MQTIKERMVVVWNDDGSFRGASLDERFEYEDGSTRNAQRPLTEEDADALLGTVDASVIAQLDAAQAKITEYDALKAERDQLAAELEALKNPPFDPRVLHPYAFLQRYTTEERIAILSASKSDAMVGLIMTELQTVSRVRLDVEATRNGVGYLMQIGIIDAARATEILRDATAEEQ